jgi:SAM-dependent methyltransferase
MDRMSAVPESPAGPGFSYRVVENDGGGVVSDYDGFAEAYAAENESSLIYAGFDSSAKMLELARRRRGPDADLRVADLADPLPYPNGGFDDVIGCLVPRYLEDWTVPLAALRRVLQPGGRLIVAVDHPFAIAFMQHEAGRKPNYFATANRTEEWTMGGHTARMSFWNRPLHAMSDAFTAAGFRIAVISEPPPAPEARERFPDAPPVFLAFLFFVLQAG